jgi:hypothetical protein
MQLGNEVTARFISDYLLEIQRESGVFISAEKKVQGKQSSLIHDLPRVRIDDILD